MKQKGTTLIETLVASTIFLIISLSIYKLYVQVIEFSTSIRATTVATQIAGEEMEFIRNLQYVDVGTEGGIPSGVVPETKAITRNGTEFSIDTTIRNVDFPADGTLGGTPNDLSPADNKLVTIEVTCTSCKITKTVTHTSFVAPKSLETENGNGALVIKAIDANGLPIVGANVIISNDTLSPAVNMSDITDHTGALTIVDAPPSTESYYITVSKNGYSTEETYVPGEVSNPNPLKPHLTVAENTVTQATFAIDRTSSIELSAQTSQCAVVPSVSGTITGAKLIGSNPNIIKNEINFNLNGSTQTINDIEWDTYNVSIDGTTYDIAGIFPVLPLSVLPNTNTDVMLTLKTSAPNRLVAAVADTNGEPIEGAEVSVSGIATSKYTSSGTVSKSDWSGGVGTDFSSSNDIDSSGGEIKLDTPGAYAPSGDLTSNTIDFGQTATFVSLEWTGNTPVESGLTPVRFQLATNNDNTTWDYVGPDGTSGTFYTSNTNSIGSAHTGHRYLRYKVFLTTDDTVYTPTVSSISISTCLPQGQVDFGGLSDSDYTVTVSKAGYATNAKTLTINSNHYETFILIPQ